MKKLGRILKQHVVMLLIMILLSTTVLGDSGKAQPLKVGLSDPEVSQGTGNFEDALDDILNGRREMALMDNFTVEYYLRMGIIVLVFAVIIGMLMKKNRVLKIAKNEIESIHQKYSELTMKKVDQFFELDLANDIMYILEKDKSEKTAICNMPEGLIRIGAVSGTCVEMFREAYKDIKENNNNITKEILYNKDNQGYKWYEMFITRMSVHLNPQWAIGTFEDISERQEKVNQLKQIAEIDSLTCIYNRAALKSRVNDLISGNEIGTLIIYDIDNFKYINDNYGHPFGDEVLREFGKILCSSFRRTDIVGRVGGDEFIIFVKGSVNQKLISSKTADSLRKVTDLKSKLNVDFNFTVSFGIAYMPEDGTTLNELYKNADKAMYEYKHKNKEKQ